MAKKQRSAIIISASSDIGTAMCRRWLARGYDIFGTYRTESQEVHELINSGAKIIYCDIMNSNSVKNACDDIRTRCRKWDVLVLCPGIQDPVGPFIDSNFSEWEKSVRINLIGQIQIVHELLPFRNTNTTLSPCVLFFAGGGTNNAPVNYSAYIVSKIALIKMCELLDAEIPDTRFAIIGPGWVKTKIHQSTIKAGVRAGTNYQHTIDKLAGEECTPMDRVLDCIDWVVQAPRNLISGRNFSVVFDEWGKPALNQKLINEPNMYKLRRYGSDGMVKNE